MRIIKIAFQWIVVLLMLTLFIRGVVFIFGGTANSRPNNENQIAVLDLSGIILDANKITGAFAELEEDPFVKGYILRVNSPGGLVTPSQQIYEYFLTLKKPLYVAMGSSAASGGYMVSLPANKIYAMPSTVTGSIGVIMQIPNYEGLYNKLGLSQRVIKSGKFKDAGNPARAMTEEEEAVLRAVVMDMFEQFVEAVSVRRNMEYADALKLADGRVYTGRMAHENGLIDGLGSWQDLFIAMKQDLELPNAEYFEYDYDPVSFWKEVTSQLKLTMIGEMPVAKPSGFYFISEY